MESVVVDFNVVVVMEQLMRRRMKMKRIENEEDQKDEGWR